MVATRRSLVRTTPSDHTTRARTPAISALETMNTGMMGTSATVARMAPWKSANQW